MKPRISIMRWVIFLVLCIGACTLLQAQNDPPNGDMYFAGIVVESSTEQLTVARVLQGKNESRVFRITPETKVEGALSARVRVTVRYVTSDDGDRATLVIVRVESPGKSKK